MPGTAYNNSTFLSIQVWAYRTIRGTRVYQIETNTSSLLFSNETFNANWSWPVVTDAEGYRVLRDLGSGFNENKDVLVNNLADDGTGWGTDVTVTPTRLQKDPSVIWNTATGGPAVGTTNALTNAWGILESINFCINGDTGPFDLYIDNLKNGSTTFQTFETVAAGTTDYGFRPPSNSGTTQPGLLAVPNTGIVTNNTADGGTNSFRVQFQWNGTNASRWLRLTTSGAGSAANPMVFLDDPISFRILLLPVGASLPVTNPTITYSLSGNQLTLNWTGSFNLESKTNLNEASWTSVGVNTGPYVTSVTNAATFYRLHNP